MLDLRYLWVNQSWVRNPDQVQDMIAHIKSGGKWDTLPKIYISVFPDGNRMIHDGHHRSIATFLAGRFILEDGEYEEHCWTYEDYGNINWKRGYYTPHDPRIELRTHDLTEFKNAVEKERMKSEAAAAEYIIKNKSQYALPLTVRTVDQLALSFAVKRAILKHGNTRESNL